MRITNNMMVHNTTNNINGNKVNVNDLNLAMSSQKKIQRPSDDPVIAIRSLRLRSSLSQLKQYSERNIQDAESWLEATETALYNMNKILTDVKTQCNNGTNSYLTADDRNTILNSLKGLKSQLYSEGNADNAGRTVFTGFKTNSQLTFMEDENDTSYEITQNFTYKDLKEFTYYSGSIEVPTSITDVQDVSKIDLDKIDKESYDRLRLAYDGVDIEADGITLTDKDGAVIGGYTVNVYESEEEWADAKGGLKTVGDDEIVLIKNSGDIIIGKQLSQDLKSDRASIQVDYKKTGFEKGVLRPEFYYNCTDVTDPKNPINYTKYDADGNKIYEDIKYTVAMNQTITINLQADDIFDMSIYQDVVELTNAVQFAIDAHAKVDRLKEMQNEVQYAGCKEEVGKWLEAAQKEADYADHRLTELYSEGVGKFQTYMDTLNIAYTEIGARGDQLEMTGVRVDNQLTTVDELKSTNEDKELSDVIIEYTAAFNAYQASLMSASKIEKQTLLNYI